MKEKFLLGRKKKELRSMAKLLGVAHYERLSSLKLMKILSNYSYKTLTKTLRESYK